MKLNNSAAGRAAPLVFVHDILAGTLLYTGLVTAAVLAAGIQAADAISPPMAVVDPTPAASSAYIETIPDVKQRRTGFATYYGPGFHGRLTSNGEIFNKYAMVAAHPSYPEGTKVRITNLENGLEAHLRINDRGPAKRIQRRGVIIDVSEGAARKLDMKHDGRVRVKLEVLEWGDRARQS
jgi:rare lipoprotein A